RPRPKSELGARTQTCTYTLRERFTAACCLTNLPEKVQLSGVAAHVIGLYLLGRTPKKRADGIGALNEGAEGPAQRRSTYFCARYSRSKMRRKTSVRTMLRSKVVVT